MLKSVKSLLFVMFCLPVAAKAEPSDRAYWIDRYLSVSYPLKSIKVSSGFGVRKDPFTGHRTSHNGLDLQASYEQAFSMFDGTVESVGSDARSGNYVIFRHGKYTVSYCHLSTVTVKAGDLLLAGDPVGYTGNTGRSTAPHLHITCRRDGEYADPYPLLVYIREVRTEAVKALCGDPSLIGRVDRVDRRAFFEKYAPLAMAQQQKYGIPSSVTLAQMFYESGGGTSRLALNGKNFFGIKCTSGWLAAGKPYSHHSDDRPNEKFCNYASVEESVEHHSRLLMSNRYHRCHRYKSTDYHNWLVAIKACGYATAPDYVRKLESMIKRHKLYLFDRLALRT